VTAFRVLGDIAVIAADGSTTGPAGTRQRTLLALLLAARGAPVSSERLADALWPDAAPANPAAALHSQVSRLREVLRDAGSAAALVSRAGSYVLTVSDSYLDLSRFESLMAAARGQRAEDAADTLAEALSLWSGSEAYPGIEDGALRAEGVRVGEARLAAVEARGATLVAAGRSREAVPELESFVAEHPLREDARGCLMRALYAVGRHAEALAHFDDYRRLLAADLGLEPSARLRTLQGQVLNHAVDVGGGPAVAAVPAGAAVPPPTDGLHTRYVTVGGARVAWTERGSGVPVVALPGWVSDLEVIASGRDPRSSLLDRLARVTRLVLYDRAGTGRSRGAAPDTSFDHAVAELAAVVDAAGPPVVLLAMSQAGPVAVRYAALHPRRVHGLVLHGTYASGPATFTDVALRDSMVALVRAHWGLGSDLLAGLYRPGAGREAGAHLAQVLRDSAPPDVAADYLAAVYEADASDVLPSVDVPCLVLHYRGDRVIPFGAGEALASGIRDARFVPLEGVYHLPDAADLDDIESVVTDFIASASARSSTP
jgi:DNA-binding SARP family transcriptional activator/pimeloyl-ACP methyl ester carboxylesterase